MIFFFFFHSQKKKKKKTKKFFDIFKKKKKFFRHGFCRVGQKFFGKKNFLGRVKNVKKIWRNT